MKYRIKKFNEKADEISISTFHSFCYGYLYDFAPYVGYEMKFGIIDDDDKLKIIRNIIKEHELDILDADAIKTISNVKNHTDTTYTSIDQAVKMNFIFHEYQAIILKNNKMDLDDLMYQFKNLLANYEALKEFLQEACEYILVDECQDTNVIQYEILEIISKKHNNLFMVGDQDQCIYTFRGSNLDNIKHFIETKQPKIIKLEENYRSNANILNVANNLIKNNNKRLDKTLYTNQFSKNYQVIYAPLENSYEEARYIANLIIKLSDAGYLYQDIAVLYRNHAISNSFEKELIRQKIPYKIIGSYPFFKHKEIKTISNYYYFLNNKDDLSLNEIYAVPPRKIGDVTFSTLETDAKQLNTSIYEQMQLSTNENIKAFVELIKKLETSFKTESPKDYIQVLLETIKYNDYLSKQEKVKQKLSRIQDFIQMFAGLPNTEYPDQETIKFLNDIYLKPDETTDDKIVKLMTIHQAKGLEFKVVIIAGCNEGILPSFKATNNDIEEERRIFYVAITRAKERLYLLSANQRTLHGKIQTFKPSSFLKNMNLECIHLDKF
ncbi:MAG: ATP-dependent helicase [Firmicutes bacterium]|nr:ATP-dependent helicase [Bacillota bacterium]